MLKLKLEMIEMSTEELKRALIKERRRKRLSKRRARRHNKRRM